MNYVATCTYGNTCVCNVGYVAYITVCMFVCSYSCTHHGSLFSAFYYNHPGELYVCNYEIICMYMASH